MSYKTKIIRLFDRPGGRFLLGKIATQVVRRGGGDGVEISYIDGFWTRQVGSYFFPDSPTFEYAYADFSGWKRQLEQYAYDTNEYWLRHYRPREGDVVVDVGAGRGEDTATFSKAVGKTGRVLAIEAHPVSFAILKNFCRLNRLTNVTPLHVAVMDKAGTVRMAESSFSWMENTVEWSGGAGGIEVPANTLDDVCQHQGLKAIDFLKMNIEGAERLALLGMETIIRHVRHICVACHDFRANNGDGERFRTRIFVEKFLASRGFELHCRYDHPQEYIRDHIFGLRAT